MSLDETDDVEESSFVEEPIETTSRYHGSNYGPSGWYWDIIEGMEVRSQPAGYSSSSTRGKNEWFKKKQQGRLSLGPGSGVHGG